MEDSIKNIERKIDLFIVKRELYNSLKLLIIGVCVYLLSILLIISLENYLWLSPNNKNTILNISNYSLISYLLGIIFLKSYIIFKKKEDKDRIKTAKEIWKISPEVDDKLVNILQLKNIHSKNVELLNIAIDSKILELNKIPFEFFINPIKAIKYTKYLIIPLSCIIILLIVLGLSNFTNSFTRLVNKDKEFIKPAPFEFEIKYGENIVENENCEISVRLKGEEIPSQLKIVYNDNSIFMQKNSISKFKHTIKNIEQNISFYIDAGEFKSKTYYISKVNTPKFKNIELVVIPPKYLKKTVKKVDNKGIIYVNDFSTLKWVVISENTDTISISKNNKKIHFMKGEENTFYSKINENSEYIFSSSNKNFKSFEKINYKFFVIKDRYPKIFVKKDTMYNLNKFNIVVEDDINLRTLKVYFYDINFTENKNSITLDSNINNQYAEINYTLNKSILDSLKIKNLSLYFEIEDNDIHNGYKKTLSEVFEYTNYSEEELEEHLSVKQNELIEKAEDIAYSKEKEKSLEKIIKKISSEDKLNWVEKQEVNKQVEKLKDSYDSFKKISESFNKSIENQIDKEDKETSKQYKDLQKSIKETEKRLKEELLKSVEDIKKDLSKDKNTLNKINNLKQQNYNTQADLKRMLKLLKKFKFENDVKRVTKQMYDLSKDLEEKSKDNNLTLQKQKNSLDRLKLLDNMMEKLNQQAMKEKYKMDIKSSLEKIKEAKKDLEKAVENIKKEKNKDAQKNNKDASEKLKYTKQKMNRNSSGEKEKQLKTDIKTIRLVLNNILIFSFKQEDNISNKGISFMNVHSSGIEKNIIAQNKLRDIFKPIKDSIYKVGSENIFIKDEVFKQIGIIEKEFNEFENNISNDSYNIVPKNQHKIMSGANKLAVILSDILQNLEMNLDSQGGSSGGEGEESQSMEEMMEEQEKLSKEMEKMRQMGQEQKITNEGQQRKDMQEGKGEKEKKGKGGERKEGKGNRDNDEDGKLERMQLEIFKKHEMLRENLFKLTRDRSLDIMMEKLSNDVLGNKINNSSKRNIRNINQRLLKIQKSIYQKEKQDKRLGQSSKKQYRGIYEDKANNPKNKTQGIEFIKYKSLEYHPFFKNKIDKYFYQ